MNSESMTFVMLPKEEWETLKIMQQRIIERLEKYCSSSVATVGSVRSEYITAKEFMDAVKIKRTKFDQLVAENKVKILKKGRKIYVAAREVEKYFKADIVE
jgi:hypothetical protein